ncbi:MAG: hypothetical protein KDE48_18715 [Anaerolineales bacterium]|nr:hypothetical protein [Anaerolineales bacterium]
MQEPAQKLIQTQPDLAHLTIFARRLLDWLIADLNQSDEPVADFTESRAKALLRAADLLDDPTRHSFERLVENETAVRSAFYDLLAESSLDADDEVAALGATSAAAVGGAQEAINWLALSIAAFAWKSGYPLYSLDPASPPGTYSPAGQVLKRAAYFIRQQVQRSATERDKLGRQLAYDAAVLSPGTPSLDEMPDAQQQIAPIPPYYRSPIPVNYPEMSRETLQVEEDTTSSMEQEADPITAVSRGTPLTITTEDLTPPEPQPVRQAPIQITSDQVQPPPAPVPQPPVNVVTPTPTVAPNAQFSNSVQRKFRGKKEPMKTTKLRILVQEFPDGPGLYGLQVRVRCAGVKSHVAGTTTKDGRFTCELPVPLNSGLTYDVDVTWPREMDSEVERKSITLNADRTEFVLPFYRQLTPKN